MKKNHALLSPRAESGPLAFMSRIPPSTFISPRIIAELDAAALRNNFQIIQDLVPGQGMMPMVKADGYGHGASWVGKMLVSLPNLYGFGVATLAEGAELRTALGARYKGLKVVVFSETVPWNDDKGNFCEEFGLTPVIASYEDWNSFSNKKWMGRVSYELQFDTGMNRLGISPSRALSIAKTLHDKPHNWHPSGVFSHLAMSESPRFRLSQIQIERFRWIKQVLHSSLRGAQFHLANSGALWNQKAFGLQDLTDVVRPGLSLYGIPPWPGAPQRGLAPVLTLKVAVVGVHRLKPGESIGYGGTYKVTGKSFVNAAILGGGYADGVKRSLSNRGYVWLGQKSSRFLGNVSMDLSAVQAHSDTRVGDWAELLGPHIDPWAQAQAAETIPYELLTSLSTRVKRIYETKFSP